MSKYIKIGHRGAMGYKLENTLPSFEHAIALGVDAIELDIHQCKTGEYLVFHDDTTERLSNSNAKIADLTLQEAKQIRLNNGQTIPTLQEALECISNKAITCIEVKKANEFNSLSKLMSNYNTDSFIYFSFNHHYLAELKKLQQKHQTCALIVGIPFNYARFASDINANYVAPNIHHANQEFVDDIYKRGMKPITWTCNTNDEINKAKQLGFWGIAGNYPDRI